MRMNVNLPCGCSTEAGICQGCWHLLIHDGVSKAQAFTAAGVYSTTSRDARRANGEHYAKPMPVSEYLCQIVRQSESV